MIGAGNLQSARWMVASLCYLLQSSNMLKITTFVSAFLVPAPYAFHISNSHRDYLKTPSFRSRKLTIVHLNDSKAPPPLPDTSDPYLLLGLTTPTADKQQIKRAYKRMALQYHPDVRLTPDSTPEDKKIANDNFARINAAYAFLSGKSSANGNPGNASSSTRDRKPGASRRKTSSTYDPPHRRTGASPEDTSSTSWEDYMPKYDEDYDTNGDSFSSIFSDFVAGSVSSSSESSSGGILSDFISFLEGNFGSSFGTSEKGEENSVEFTDLLNNGSAEDIKNEMDDANLLAKQLEQKDLALTKEYEEVLSNGSNGSQGIDGSSYLDKMRLEERKGEIEARQEVVRKYLNKANVRRVKLRKRYEELRSSRDSSWSSRTASESAGNDSPSSSGDEQKKDTSWKRESFGSNGRRRRRGSRAGRPTSSSSSSGAYSPNSSRSSGTDASANSREDSKRKSNSSRKQATNTSQSDSAKESRNVPPHRRLKTTFLSPYAEKKRLREIKVEEKIDEMKRELGL